MTHTLLLSNFGPIAVTVLYIQYLHKYIYPHQDRDNYRTSLAGNTHVIASPSVSSTADIETTWQYNIFTLCSCFTKRFYFIYISPERNKIVKYATKEKLIK